MRATLMDALFRRVGLGWRCAFTSAELARAAEVIGDELGWSDARKEQEIQAFRAEAAFLFDQRQQLRPIRSLRPDRDSAPAYHARDLASDERSGTR